MPIEPSHLLLVFICLALGGILKGATGAGAPILAIPALAAVFDVKLAVIIMIMPNMLTNVLQVWRYREHRLKSSLGWIFALSGAIGVLVGTIMLASLSHEILSLIVAIAVLTYVLIRLARPNWTLDFNLAKILTPPAGFISGILQGSSGISAPVSISFLNAMKLERYTYIFTISTFFVAMTLVQLPTLGLYGLLSFELLGLSLLAVLPILAFMPVGAALAKRLSPAAFDKAILLLLAALAAKLILEAFPINLF